MASLGVHVMSYVPDVVFPTAIEEIDGHQFVFYGMADSSIGVASLDRMDAP